MADKKISELDELTTPSSTDVLPISHGEDTYKVKVQNLVPPSSSSLEDLEDVEITTPSDGDALVYDEENEKWVNGQGGGKQTALTQAEYDALVEAGTVDPTMEYFITDGIPASVKYYHNYSTDEQIVGTWIDGSLIYEKTFEVTNPQFHNTDASFNHGISNFGKLIGVSGHIEQADGDDIPFPYESSSGDYCVYYGNVNSTRLLYRFGGFYDSTKIISFYVTIQYTKSV